MLILYLTLTDDEEHSAIVEKLYHRWNPLMYGIALQILRDETMAEDAVYDSMLLLIEWTRTHRERDPEKLKGLIFLVVRQRALRLLRQQNRTVSLETLTGFEPSVPFEPEERGPMLEALDRLRPEHREILQLRYLNDLSMKEISKILNIGLSAAQMRLHRARQAIKQEVEKCHYEI